MCIQTDSEGQLHSETAPGCHSGALVVVVQLLSRVWLFCNLMDCSSPGSSVHGILQARILEWVAISFSRGSSWPRDQICSSLIGRWILYCWDTKETLESLVCGSKLCLLAHLFSWCLVVVCCMLAAAAKSLESCLTLCDPIDGSPPASTFRGMLQARVLEWVAISFSNAWKVKRESEVAQSCPTLSDPMDCSSSMAPPSMGFSRQKYLEYQANWALEYRKKQAKG